MALRLLLFLIQGDQGCRKWREFLHTKGVNHHLAAVQIVDASAIKPSAADRLRIAPVDAVSLVCVDLVRFRGPPLTKARSFRADAPMVRRHEVCAHAEPPIPEGSELLLWDETWDGKTKLLMTQ